MGYSVQINNTINALASCIRKIDNGQNNWGWDASVNGSSSEIYLNFNIETKEFIIGDYPMYEEMDSLDEILELLSEDEG